MKRKITKKLFIFISALMLTFCLAALPSKSTLAYDPIDNEGDADVDKKNSETGYRVVIYDGAELFSSSEIKKLAETMAPVTQYGNAVFITVDDDDFKSANDYSYYLYDDLFGDKNGLAFIIDLDPGVREIYIHTDGDIRKVVTDSWTKYVTDNVYRYAMDGDYYSCASECFVQINRLLAGQKVARPMKYVCTGLMALLISLLINYWIVSHASRIQKTSSAEMLSGASQRFNCTPPNVYQTGQTRTYSPQSSGSSGGGGSRGGGGGGGGHHGGGGGHRF